MSIHPPAVTTTGKIRILRESGEDRYDRQRLLPWWDQDVVGQARVVVVGAGAIGNEVWPTFTPSSRT